MTTKDHIKLITIKMGCVPLYSSIFSMREFSAGKHERGLLIIALFLPWLLAGYTTAVMPNVVRYCEKIRAIQSREEGSPKQEILVKCTSSSEKSW